MTEKNESENISMTNTKKEMLEAYQNIKVRYQKREKDVFDAEKTRKMFEKKLAEAAADSQASQDPLERLFKLKGDISRELTALAEKFEQEIDIYQKIQTAVKEKQKYLDGLYEIETAASDLAALIEAQQEKKNQFEHEMQTQKSVFEEEVQLSRARWDKETAAFSLAAKEKATAIEKTRQREKEEYEYTFTRKKEQRENALNDALKKLETEIGQKRRDFDQQLHQRKAELDDREKLIAEQETETAHLKKDAENFPQKMKAEIEAAGASATERLTRDFEKNIALIEAQSEGEKNVFKSRIEALEKLVKSQENQMAKISERHEQAYEKVQDIANRAVSAAKREFISIPVTSQRASEQDERK